MKNFKVIVSKWTKKNTLIKKSESEAMLKSELHSEWYSILSIEEVWDVEIKWNKFYFEILKDWEIKKWTIWSSDSFKAYLKLKDDLWYDVKYLYSNKDETEMNKRELIHELKEQYKIFKEIHKDELSKKEDLDELKTKPKKEEWFNSFAMKKELEKNLLLINKVVSKIDWFLKLEWNEYLNFHKKEQLQQIYNELIKLKSSTNIKKLREVAELWLIKVWEIELSILESNKDDESRKILKETNKLLKEVWSKQSFIEKDKDITLILKKSFENFVNYYNQKKEDYKKNKSFKIDTKSSDYLKTKALYNKYLQKYRELKKERNKKMLLFLLPSKNNIQEKEYLNLKKLVLEQNLRILKIKLTWKTFSYVKVVKWYMYLIWKLLDFLNFFKKPILLITLIYSFVFLMFNLFSFLWYITYELNFIWLFYFIFVNLAFILLNYTRWLFTLGFNVVFLSFIYIFGLINF